MTDNAIPMLETNTLNQSGVYKCNVDSNVMSPQNKKRKFNTNNPENQLNMYESMQKQICELRAENKHYKEDAYKWKSEYMKLYSKFQIMTNTIDRITMNSDNTNQIKNESTMLNSKCQIFTVGTQTTNQSIKSSIFPCTSFQPLRNNTKVRANNNTTNIKRKSKIKFKVVSKKNKHINKSKNKMCVLSGCKKIKQTNPHNIKNESNARRKKSLYKEPTKKKLDDTNKNNN
eukprot:444632_1